MNPFPAFAPLPVRGRPPSQEQAIICALKDDLFAGRLRPGERLPLRIELERRFDAASNTVQRAMTHLIRDGFVEAKGKRGTFVAERPPHLNRFGMVWSGDPSESAPNTKFAQFLYQEAKALEEQSVGQLIHYMCVDGHTDREGARRLLQDVQGRRLAGLVFDAPTCLYRSPFYELLDTPHLPCVLINEGFDHAKAIHVTMRTGELIDHALEHLQDLGRRRVALLTAGHAPTLFGHFERAVAARGLETRPFWMQGAAAGSPCARNAMHLLMHASERPDALIITDDSLVEAATAGLADAGAECPKRLMVVAHANFPYITPSVVPATRLGFQVPEILATALDLVVRSHTGRRVPHVVRIAPVFEAEAAAGRRRA